MIIFKSGKPIRNQRLAEILLKRGVAVEVEDSQDSPKKVVKKGGRPKKVIE